ncbi:MAG: MFS transporter, partial [Planctomycetota bacterium]
SPVDRFWQRSWVRLAVLTFLHFPGDFYGGLRMPLVQPTLMEHLGVGFGAVTLILIGSAILVNAVQPLSGWLLPNRGFPMLLLLCPIFAATMTLIGLTQAYWGVGALMAVSALGIGILHPEGMLAAHAASGKRQGLGVAFYLSGGFFGYSLAGWISASWATRWGLTGFYLLGLPLLIAAGLTLLTGLHRLQGHTESEAPASIRHRIPFPLVMALTVLIAAAVTLVCYYITPYMVRRFGREAQAAGGMAIFGFGMAGALASYLWGHLSERFMRCHLITGCLLFSIPLLALILFWADSPRTIIVLCTLTGAFAGAIFPLGVVLGRGSAGGSPRLRAGLLIGGAWGMGSLLVMATGVYVDRFPDDSPGPIRNVLLLTLLIPLIGAAIALLISPRERADAG